MDFKGSDFEFWSFWFQATPEKEEQAHCLQGANPALPRGEGPLRGDSHQFFVGAFWDAVATSSEKTLMTETLQLFIFGFRFWIWGFLDTCH